MLSNAWIRDLPITIKEGTLGIARICILEKGVRRESKGKRNFRLVITWPARQIETAIRRLTTSTATWESWYAGQDEFGTLVMMAAALLWFGTSWRESLSLKISDLTVKTYPRTSGKIQTRRLRYIFERATRDSVNIRANTTTRERKSEKISTAFCTQSPKNNHYSQTKR